MDCLFNISREKNEEKVSKDFVGLISFCMSFGRIFEFFYTFAFKRDMFLFYLMNVIFNMLYL